MIRVAPNSPQPDNLNETISSSLTPGKSVTRYNRVWRLPKYTRREGFVYGRLGFEYPESTTVGVWDESTRDYTAIRPAQITPFVLHLATGRVVFELKANTIKPWTFQSNFQALLNHDSRYRWRVTLEGVTYPSWEEWEKFVTRITHLQIRMNPPNPHYESKAIEDVLENAKANAASLVLNGDDIDPDSSTFVSQALKHGKRYGHIHAKGFAGDDKREWKSEEDGIDREQAPRDRAHAGGST